MICGRIFSYWMMVGLLLIMPRGVGAAIEVIPVGGTDRRWVLLAVTGFAEGREGDVQVRVRDVRGGICVWRTVVGGTDRVLLPLALEGRAALTDGNWPLEVSVKGNSGKNEYRVVVPSVSNGGPGTFRVALPIGAMSEASEIQWKFFSPLPVEWVEVPGGEILRGPALLFAGCDAVFVPAAQVEGLSEQRALQLMASGARLMVAGQNPPTGELSHFVWELGGGPFPATGPGTFPFASGKAAWVCPEIGLRGPRVVEVEAENVRMPLDLAKTPSGVKWGLVLLGPVAVFLLVLVRGMTGNKGSVLAASAVVLTGLGVGGIVFVSSFGGGKRYLVAEWGEMRGVEGMAVGGLELHEKVFARRSIVGSVVEDRGSMVLPLARSLADYWKMRDVQLELSGDQVRSTSMMAARQEMLFQEREVHLRGLVPAFPRDADVRRRFQLEMHDDTSSGWWLMEGYVYRGDAGDFLSGGTVFTNWIRDHEDVRPSLEAWYSMRFEGGRRYYLRLNGGGVQLVDFGLSR